MGIIKEKLSFFHLGDLRPAGGGFREFAGGEAPDDELLALDQVSVLGGFAVEIRADGRSCRAFDRDARKTLPRHIGE